MKAIVLACDRCGTTVTSPYETFIVEDYSPKAIRCGIGPTFDPADWAELADDQAVTDVCPDCLTAGERADRLFREVACDVMLNREQTA